MTESEFYAIEPRLAGAIGAGRFEEATEIIDAVVRDSTGHVLGSVLVYKGTLAEDRGAYEDAAEAFAAAAEHLRPGSYARYAALLSLSGARRATNDVAGASRATIAAMITAAEPTERFSGASALSQWLDLRDLAEGSLDSLIRSVATRSWQVLGLPGNPDVSELPTVVSTLRQAQQRKE